MSETATGTPDPLSAGEAIALLTASDAICKGEPFPEKHRGEYAAAMRKTNGQLNCLDWARTYVSPLLGRPLRDDDTALGLVAELRKL